MNWEDKEKGLILVQICRGQRSEVMKKDGAGHVALPLAARRYTHFCWLQKLHAAGQIGGELFLASRLPTAAAEENGCRYRRGTSILKLSCGLNHLHCVGRERARLGAKSTIQVTPVVPCHFFSFLQDGVSARELPGAGGKFRRQRQTLPVRYEKWPALAINTRFPLIMD